MTKSRKPGNMATFAEKMKIHEILIERLHPVEGTDLFRYEDGWSDLRVSQTVRDTLTGSPAATVRKEVFGQLMYAQGGSPRREHERRITALENQLRRLMSVCNISAADRARVIGDVGTNKDAPQP